MLLRSTAPTFTRPADTTAYAAADLVANSTTAASVVPLAFAFSRPVQIGIRQAIIKASVVTITNKAFTLHLFSAAPTFVTAGDNSAMATVVATGAPSWIGAIDITAMRGFADGSIGVGAPLFGQEIIWQPSTAPVSGDGGSQTLYGILEARAAYAPGDSETFSVTLAGTPVG